jgi:DNA-directed RNA polymerase specialized sigma24 family protein
VKAPAPRPPRTPRLAAEAARALTATAPGRGRIRLALERCGDHERNVLAVFLLERLTPDEAAQVLGVPARHVLRTFRAVMAALALAARRGGRSARPSVAGRAAVSEPRLRRI